MEYIMSGTNPQPQDEMDYQNSLRRLEQMLIQFKISDQDAFKKYQEYIETNKNELQAHSASLAEFTAHYNKIRENIDSIITETRIAKSQGVSTQQLTAALNSTISVLNCEITPSEYKALAKSMVGASTLRMKILTKY